MGPANPSVHNTLCPELRPTGVTLKGDAGLSDRWHSLPNESASLLYMTGFAANPPKRPQGFSPMSKDSISDKFTVSNTRAPFQS